MLLINFRTITMYNTVYIYLGHQSNDSFTDKAQQARIATKTVNNNNELFFYFVLVRIAYSFIIYSHLKKKQQQQQTVRPSVKIC